VTFAQTWDVRPLVDAVVENTVTENAVLANAGPGGTSGAAGTSGVSGQSGSGPGSESMPPGLGTAGPSSLRQVFLMIGPESARAARDFTKSTLREWGLDGLAQEAALVASELVTNAIRHGACCVAVDDGQEQGRVELSWQRQASRVICMVTDRSPRPPVLSEADTDAESGRGLQVVEALAATWGWMMLGARSKAVWAALATRPNRAG
jgi:anti-sigma regulatory factor (Ser/Thr protein kinase)